jgi:hypothetical protein
MSISSPIKIATDNLVFHYDAGSKRSYVGAPTSNVYFTPTPDSSGNVGFSVNGTGTFKRILQGRYGGYDIQATDVVYRYDLGGLGCHYHGNDYNIPSGYYATFAFDYYISPGAGSYPVSNLLVSIENNGNGIGAQVADYDSTTGVWKRAVMSPNATSNGSGFTRFLLYPGGCGNSTLATSGYILYKNPQAELRPFASSYIPTGASSTGSRSVTSSLFDFTGNYNIDLTSAGYDSSGGLLYSGAQNLSVGDMGSQFQNFTVDIWFKSNAVENYRNPIDCNWLQYNGSYSNIGPRLEQNSSGNLVWTVGDISSNYQSLTVVSSGLDSSKYHNAVITKDGTSLKTYYNGNLVTSTTATYTHPGYFRSVQIGRGFSTSSERWFSGTIPICRIYNRALTASELSLNYNASKGRFGLL